MPTRIVQAQPARRGLAVARERTRQIAIGLGFAAVGLVIGAAGAFLGA